MSKAQLVSFDVEATVGDAARALTFLALRTSGGLSLSSQTDTVPARYDAVRVVACLLGV